MRALQETIVGYYAEYKKVNKYFEPKSRYFLQYFGLKVAATQNTTSRTRIHTLILKLWPHTFWDRFWYIFKAFVIHLKFIIFADKLSSPILTQMNSLTATTRPLGYFQGPAVFKSLVWATLSQFSINTKIDDKSSFSNLYKFFFQKFSISTEWPSQGLVARLKFPTNEP